MFYLWKLQMESAQPFLSDGLKSYQTFSMEFVYKVVKSR